MILQTYSNSSALHDKYTAELIEENATLFKHLHFIQEELERLYSLRKKENFPSDGAEAPPWDGKELLMVFAESHRLQAITKAQQYLLRIETENSLPARLGTLLLSNWPSSGIVGLLVSLWTFWRTTGKTKAPKSLGGKTYSKVISAYEQGSREAVQALLENKSFSPGAVASAYTALARHLMQSNEDDVVFFAQRAYETEPRPYRLKWLIFRLHDAGAVTEAEALLDISAADIPMSDSERREVSRIRSTSKAILLSKAQEIPAYEAIQRTIQGNLRDLLHLKEREEMCAQEQANKVESLLSVQTRLEEEKAVLLQEKMELEDAGVRLEEEKAVLLQEKKELEDAGVRLEEEKAVLLQEKMELEDAGVRLEEEKIVLIREKLESESAHTKLEQDKECLKQQYFDQIQLNNKFQAELVQVVQTLQIFEKEKTASFRRIHELESQVIDMARVRDSLACLLHDQFGKLVSAFDEQKNTLESILQKKHEL